MVLRQFQSNSPAVTRSEFHSAARGYNLISTLYTNYANSKCTITKIMLRDAIVCLVTRRELWSTLSRFDVSLIYKAMYPLQPPLSIPIVLSSLALPPMRASFSTFSKRDKGRFCVIKNDTPPEYEFAL